MEDQDYEWACFAAQQAAEKAVKALHLRLGLEGWGHSIKQLLASLPPQEAIPDALHETGLRLDRFHIPIRYPNGFAQAVPGECFLARDAVEAIDDAERILEFIPVRLGLQPQA